MQNGDAQFSNTGLGVNQDAGIIDEDIQPLEVIFNPADGSLNRHGIRDIQQHKVHFQPKCRHFAPRF